MINKGQWIVLLYSAVRHLPGLRISPPGVIPQRDRRPHWIVDYSWWDVNDDTLPLAATEAMQFGHALDRILREILLANPAFGPVHLLKLDISDGFYCIALNIDDIPKLGMAFPTANNADPLVALPLVLPMGWKNSPPIFSTATETIADIANARITAFAPPMPHHLDNMAELIASSPPALGGSTVPTLRVSRDPSLPSLPTPLAYVDVYMDDFVGAAQCSPAGSRDIDNRRRVRRLLLQTVDDIFRPLSRDDGPDRREPVSMKKLAAGDCSWGTVKQVLGWVIDTVDMTIALPPHRAACLLEILDSFPPSQRRTSTKRWHGALGELRSMALALPGARHVFSSMQNALSTQSKNRIALGNGVHDALADFRWMHSNITTRPTRIAELVPLPPVALGHHDASGKGAGGIWFPGDHLTLREGYAASTPLVWRHEWPPHVISRLVTDSNPSGSITNSDLELAGGLLHLDAIAHAFDIWERTVLSQGDNLSTTFWERNGSTTTASAPAYLLRLFGIHQQHHRYVPRFDYISVGWLSNLDPITADRFRGDLGSAQTTVLAGISPGRASSNATAWAKWTFLNMGAKDPCLNSASKIDFRIQRILRAWTNSDPAPLRVKPIPITVIRHIAASATSALATSTLQAASDMIILAFFFLLRPGEYTDNAGDPFRLTDVQLFIGDTRLPLLTAPASELCLARFALLTFTTQKNGVAFSTPFYALSAGFRSPNKVTASYLTARIHAAVAASRVDPDVICLIGR
ncbi:hypothetical protein ACHAXA_010699 [Cyclostephanos tholiformis]|uniref:Reverse transcriptase domain-containing protein n=1 Tax=Cyclostephanos tholiformis TaxID=382380 RepID=A0ABD3SEQ8_9STRA